MFNLLKILSGKYPAIIYSNNSQKIKDRRKFYNLIKSSFKKPRAHIRLKVERQ